MTRKEERNELHRLYDMLEAIENIQTQPEYTEGREAFDRDQRYQVWVIFHIERIGECSASLREQHNYDEKHPELELGNAQGMRRRLVHKYWDTDPDLVWKAVEYLPKLKDLLEKVVKEKEQLREESKEKDELEKPIDLVLPFPEPKSHLETLANKRAIMRAEGKLEKEKRAQPAKKDPRSLIDDQQKSKEQERDQERDL